MALAWIRDESEWVIAVIGGVAKPALEGWMLALRGVHGTDSMSRARAQEHIRTRAIELKSTEEYVAIVEQAGLGAAPHFGLPSGADSLRQWLALANDVLHRVVHGGSAGDR
jgi:hypothetical protein